MTKIVVDTNVIVSANISSSGNPAEIMNQVYLGVVTVYYSKGILAEYKRVLSYEKFDFPVDIQKGIIEAIEEVGILIEPPVSTITLPDETDRGFYDTAKASGAILITGNIKHYPAEPFIMSPTDFMKAHFSSPI